VGISGSAGTNDTFAVKFCKQVLGTTLLKDALAAAFAGFVLPLHSQTYQLLQPGDYLYHQFNATLNLGFGAELGIDKVFFSGQYKTDVPKSLPGAPSISLSGKGKLKVGASFGASFKYTGSFEAFLEKVDDKTGHLHLYKSKTDDVNFKLGATITVIADPAVTLFAGDLTTLANKVLPGGTGKVVGQLLGKEQDHVNAWIKDVQTKINSWLKPFQQGQTQLQVAIDDTHSTFLLIDATFDLTAVGFPAAWNKIIAGDFNAAMTLPNSGVSLDAGSGLEEFHNRTTSVTLNLFGLFKAEFDSSQIENYSMIYVGNNVFHLIERIGDRQISTINGKGREVDFYFAAEATASPAGIKIGSVNLYVLLKATSNPSFGQSIAGFLSRTATGDVARQLTNQLAASAKQKNTTETLQLIFNPSAYGRVQSSTLNGNHPIVNENLDQNNYTQFSAACAQFFGDSRPANFSVSQPGDLNYPLWRTWNIIANGSSDPANGVPSRRDPVDMNNTAGATFLDVHFRSQVSSVLIQFILNSASRFMNLCEDLHHLATLTESSATSWADLHAALQQIVQQDVPADFLIPTSAALTTLMSQAGVQPAISGPAPASSPQPSILVTLAYS
jgi:hypothetical protein